VGHPLHGYSQQPDVHSMELSAPLFSAALGYFVKALPELLRNSMILCLVSESRFDTARMSEINF